MYWPNCSRKRNPGVKARVYFFELHYFLLSNIIFHFVLPHGKISVGSTKAWIGGQNGAIDLTGTSDLPDLSAYNTHINSTSNPHGVSCSQIGAATSGHTHTQYAATNHSHSSYSSIGHNHDDRYALAGNVGLHMTDLVSLRATNTTPAEADLGVDCTLLLIHSGDGIIRYKNRSWYLKMTGGGITVTFTGRTVKLTLDSTNPNTLNSYAISVAGIY